MDSDSDAARQVTGRGHRALPLWAGLGRPLPHLSYSGGALMPAPLRHAATRDWSTMSESAVSSTELFRLKVLTISSQVTTGFPPVFFPLPGARRPALSPQSPASRSPLPTWFVQSSWFLLLALCRYRPLASSRQPARSITTRWREMARFPRKYTVPLIGSA